jgi:hypothetical protein
MYCSEFMVLEGVFLHHCYLVWMIVKQIATNFRCPACGGSGEQVIFYTISDPLGSDSLIK